MIERVVSGGQTGVDRAALDVALSLGIPCTGWCPKGRLAEDGPIPARYPLEETPTAFYEERTAWNVRDSDATIILTWGEPTGGTELALDMAHMHGKPCRTVDLAVEISPNSARKWIQENRIRVLNVAGPRSSKDPEVYPRARAFLEALLAKP